MPANTKNEFGGPSSRNRFLWGITVLLGMNDNDVGRRCCGFRRKASTNGSCCCSGSSGSTSATGNEFWFAHFLVGRSSSGYVIMILPFVFFCHNDFFFCVKGPISVLILGGIFFCWDDDDDDGLRD